MDLTKDIFKRINKYMMDDDEVDITDLKECIEKSGIFDTSKTRSRQIQINIGSFRNLIYRYYRTNDLTNEDKFLNIINLEYPGCQDIINYVYNDIISICKNGQNRKKCLTSDGVDFASIGTSYMLDKLLNLYKIICKKDVMHISRLSGNFGGFSFNMRMRLTSFFKDEFIAFSTIDQNKIFLTSFLINKNIKNEEKILCLRNVLKTKLDALVNAACFYTHDFISFFVKNIDLEFSKSETSIIGTMLMTSIRTSWMNFSDDQVKVFAKFNVSPLDIIEQTINCESFDDERLKKFVKLCIKTSEKYGFSLKTFLCKRDYDFKRFAKILIFFKPEYKDFLYLE